LFGEPTSQAPHTNLKPAAIYATPDHGAELRYLCKRYGMKWSRTFASAFESKPAVWGERA